MTKSLVSIIVVSRRANTLYGCIDTLMEQTYSNIEIIVIWNGSTSSLLTLKDKYKNNKLIRFVIDGNNNVSSGRNKGINSAKGNLVAFTDDDCRVNKNWIELLIKELSSSSKIAGTGSLRDVENSYSLIANLCQISDIKIGLMSEKYKAMDEKNIYLCTSSALFRKSILNEVNGFDENLISGEDSDLSIRIKKQGYLIKLVPEARVTHYHPDSLDGVIKQQLWYGFGDFFLWEKYEWGSYKGYIIRFMINLFNRISEAIIYAFKSKRIELLILPIYVLIIDLSRLVGYFRGLFGSTVNSKREINN